MAVTKNPYMTDQQVRNLYSGYERDFTNQQTKLADRQKASTNANYDNRQQENYITYMQNQRDLNNQLADAGIVGGASESARLRGQTNYENNRNLTERQRGADITAINNALNNAIANFRQQNNLSMEDRLISERNSRQAWEQARQEQEENRYAKTISGWDTISGIDAEIAKINRSGVDLWRIPYLRARRAELAEIQAEQAAASGGGGSYYSSYSGGGGGSTANTQNNNNASLGNSVAGVVGNVANIFKNGSSSSTKKKKSGGTSSGSNIKSWYNLGGTTGRWQR